MFPNLGHRPKTSNIHPRSEDSLGKCEAQSNFPYKQVVTQVHVASKWNSSKTCLNTIITSLNFSSYVQ